MSITGLKNCNSLIVIQSVYSCSQNIWLLLSLLSGFLGKVAAGQASASAMVKVRVFIYFFIKQLEWDEVECIPPPNSDSPQFNEA